MMLLVRNLARRTRVAPTGRGGGNGSEDDRTVHDKRLSQGACVAIGAGIGAAIGSAIDNLGVGIGVGVAIGAAIGAKLSGSGGG
jgi:hypothetical protein